jgi:alanine dehydrogenase
MPGCVPRTSTYALTNATAPYVARIANLGYPEFVKQDAALRRGTTVVNGRITHPAVAQAFGMECVLVV